MSSVSGLPSESKLTYVPLIVFYFCEFSSIALPALHARPLCLYARARTLIMSFDLFNLSLRPPSLSHPSRPLPSSRSEFCSFPPSSPVLHVNLALVLHSGSQSPPVLFSRFLPRAAFYISVLLFILKQSPSIPQLSFLSAMVSFQLKPTKLRKWAFETLISGRAPLRDKQ